MSDAYNYLNQRQWWLPNGRSAVPIKSMDKAWRFNASRWLERHSERFMSLYRAAYAVAWFRMAWEDMPDGAFCALSAENARQGRALALSPTDWMLQTPLHQELVRGLPTKRRKVEKLARRAHHWSFCPLRQSGHAEGATCSCPPRELVF